jgi:Mn2+/Fe2+ NRAMP family transporter
MRNALTIVTEFIGITLALGYLGLPKLWGVMTAAALVMLAATTGNFRRFERFALMLVLGSLLVFPVLLFIHPPVGQMIQDMMVPKMPQGAALNEVMLLIIAIVGTTVAPWQLFFQQSYVVDKRIRPRFIRYERVDLMIGIAIVIAGALSIMSFTAHTFAGRPEFGNFVGISVKTASNRAEQDRHSKKMFSPD